ncbi:MAG: FHA domain-containing protein [Phycisphaerales bacterium]|nr:FHA domain-containing protein [bacterium]
MFEIIARDRQSTVLGRLELTGQKLVRIGRGRDCDFRLHNAAVSRKHGELELIDDGQWVYRDLGSTHGSFINDAPLDGDVPIRPNLSLRLGPISLMFLDLATRIGRELDALIPEDDDELEIRIIARNRSLDRASQLDDTIA